MASLLSPARKERLRESLSNLKEKGQNLVADVQQRRRRDDDDDDDAFPASRSTLPPMEVGGMMETVDLRGVDLTDDENEDDDNDGALPYTLGDHASHVHLRFNDKGYAYCDTSQLMVDHVLKLSGGVVKDFCSPMPEAHLQALYTGIEASPVLSSTTQEKGSTATTTSTTAEALPVRTITFRLRPDTAARICINALEDACESLTGITVQVLENRVGVYSALLLPDESSECLSFRLDARVCTARVSPFERVLLVRVFYAALDTDPSENGSEDAAENPYSTPTKPGKPPTSPIKDSRSPSVESQSTITDGLKDACCCLQYMEKERNKISRRRTLGNLKLGGKQILKRGAAKNPLLAMHKLQDDLEEEDPMDVPSPAKQPASTTAHMRNYFDPSVSVRITQELEALPEQGLFFMPSLNTKDEALIETSWDCLFRIWNNLIGYNCAFHTIVDLPLCDRGEGDEHGPIFDSHYCTQLRYTARDNMLEATEPSFQQVRNTLTAAEKQFQDFVRLLSWTWARLKMPKRTVQALTSKPPYVSLPTREPPDGYSRTATLAARNAEEDPENPAGLNDEAVDQIFQAFYGDDDQYARDHLNSVSKLVADRLEELHKVKVRLVEELEKHPTAEGIAKRFCKSARLATNAKGRVERLVFAKVPLLDFEMLGGSCHVTSTNILLMKEGLLGRTTHTLFDLKAIEFRTLSSNCLSVVTVNNDQTVYKINTAVNIEHLSSFLHSLKAMETKTANEIKARRAKTKATTEVPSKGPKSSGGTAKQVKSEVVARNPAGTSTTNDNISQEQHSTNLAIKTLDSETAVKPAIDDDADTPNSKEGTKNAKPRETNDKAQDNSASKEETESVKQEDNNGKAQDNSASKEDTESAKPEDVNEKAMGNSASKDETESVTPEDTNDKTKESSAAADDKLTKDVEGNSATNGDNNEESGSLKVNKDLKTKVEQGSINEGDDVQEGATSTAVNEDE